MALIVKVLKMIIAIRILFSMPKFLFQIKDSLPSKQPDQLMNPGQVIVVVFSLEKYHIDQAHLDLQPGMKGAPGEYLCLKTIHPINQFHSLTAKVVQDGINRHIVMTCIICLTI